MNADPSGDWDAAEPIRIPIESVIDLHAFADRDVKAVVEEYLLAAHDMDMTDLRIIHGRGIGARRALVRRILAETTFVHSFADAPLGAGGWGATVVTLRPRSAAAGPTPR